MQVFRPEDIDLATAPDANPCFGTPSGIDLPVMRSVVRQESRDGGLRSGGWDSAAGTATFRHTADEWAYILEGEVQVTAAGKGPSAQDRGRLLHARRRVDGLGGADVCPQGVGPSPPADRRTDPAQAWAHAGERAG
jgi:uncharacterized cupin superfamily protein